VKGNIPPSLAEEQQLSQNTPAKSQREMDEVEEVDEEDDEAHSGDEGNQEVTLKSYIFKLAYSITLSSLKLKWSGVWQ
jgi:hypothetical protein